MPRTSGNIIDDDKTNNKKIKVDLKRKKNLT